MGERRTLGGGRRGTTLVLALLTIIPLSQCAPGAGAPQSQHPSGTNSREVRSTPTSAAAASSTSVPPTSAAPVSRPPVATTTGTQTTAGPLWRVVRIVDGDTIHVQRGAVVEKVRLIGIDTPESGECGFTAAVDSLRRILGDRDVSLAPGAPTNRDRYGRLLRYVMAGGTDAGLAQIKAGYAVARFDSRDGYGAHAREAAYIAADRASPDHGWRCATPAPVKPQSTWPLPGDEHPCPRERPIKGNESSMIAHSPGQQSYLVTNPEQCFATLSDAVAAGFRPAKR